MGFVSQIGDRRDGVRVALHNLIKKRESPAGAGHLVSLVAGACFVPTLAASKAAKGPMVAGGCSTSSLGSSETVEKPKKYRFDLLFNAYDITDVFLRTGSL